MHNTSTYSTEQVAVADLFFFFYWINFEAVTSEREEETEIWFKKIK